jgi:ribosomal protein S27E
MVYSPRVRWLKVMCPECDSVPQKVSNPNAKTRQCAFCPHVIDIKNNTVERHTL